MGDSERLIGFLDEKYKRLTEEVELARKLKPENSAAAHPLFDEEIATSLLALSLYQTHLNIPVSFSPGSCADVLFEDLKSRSPEL